MEKDYIKPIRMNDLGYPMVSLHRRQVWPKKMADSEVEVQVSDWGKDACPICASDFHLDRRSAVSCDCGGACQVWGGKTRPRHEIHPKI